MNLYQKYFKRKPNIRNIYHPDIWPHITESFIGPGVHGKNTQYYTWKGGDLLDDTIGRYHAADRHVTEFAMKMNVDELVKYLDIIIGHLEPNEGGKIKVGLATAKLYEMKERTKLLATNDTLLRLASCEKPGYCLNIDGKDHSVDVLEMQLAKLVDAVRKKFSTGVY